MAWSRYVNDNLTGFEVQVQTGGIYTPRAYCDSSDMGMVYTNKPPTCQLSLDPNPQYLGSAIDWDISGSSSATSTIEEFHIEWGGDTDIGDLSNQDWFTDPLTGEVVYDELGTYTVEAWVVDLLGIESQHVFITVEIVPAPPPEFGVGLGAAGSGGSFYFASAIGEAWEKRVSGLTEAQKEFQDFIVDPHFYEINGYEFDPETVILHGAGEGFSVYSENTGGSWGDFTPYLPAPTNDWSDTPAPDIETAIIKKIVGDPFRLDVFYRLVSWQNNENNYRAWIYYTVDNGISHIIYPLEGELQAYGLGMDIDKEDGTVLWVTSWEGDEGEEEAGTLTLRKYIIGSGSLVLADTIELSLTPTLAQVLSGHKAVYPFAPDGDKDLLYLFGGKNITTSQLSVTTNGGASFSPVTLAGFGSGDVVGALYVGPDSSGRDVWLTRHDYNEA